MKKLLFTSILFLSLAVSAKVKIAVLDTGLDPDDFKALPICEGESKDFTGAGIQDDHGHGTNIAGLISSKLPPKSDYCLVIVKVFDVKRFYNSIEYTKKGFEYAVTIGADVINYSGGGSTSDWREKVAVKRALNSGIKIFVAGGNNGKSLDDECDFFPACYDNRLDVVGSVDSSGKISKTSNYGKVVSIYETGEKQSALGVTLSGTSQATAIATGKYVHAKLYGK